MEERAGGARREKCRGKWESEWQEGGGQQNPSRSMGAGGAPCHGKVVWKALVMRDRDEGDLLLLPRPCASALVARRPLFTHSRTPQTSGSTPVCPKTLRPKALHPISIRPQGIPQAYGRCGNS